MRLNIQEVVSSESQRFNKLQRFRHSQSTDTTGMS